MKSMSIGKYLIINPTIPKWKYFISMLSYFSYLSKSIFYIAATDA